jgi:hypothetical protein
MDGNRHKKTAMKEGCALFKQKDLYRIPQLLVEEIMTPVNVVCFR